MPIYQVGEHELLAESSSMITGIDEQLEGKLFLTDKRLIFEKHGKKSLLRASPGQTVIDLYLYEIKNVYGAVPKLRIFTTKTLTVEYLSEGEIQSVKFALRNPDEWESDIRKFASDLKKLHEDEQRRTDEDMHRRSVEMARAKAGTTNVGVMNVRPEGTTMKKKETVVDAEGAETLLPQRAPTTDVVEYDGNCIECGGPLPFGSKFCPSCGLKVTKK